MWFSLVPKLQLGNSGGEAPASQDRKLELPRLVPKLELGNQHNHISLNRTPLPECAGFSSV